MLTHLLQYAIINSVKRIDLIKIYSPFLVEKNFAADYVTPVRNQTAIKVKIF